MSPPSAAAALTRALALADPAVAISDFALALVGAGCAVAVACARARARAGEQALRRGFAAFFCAVAAAALAGGLDHGLFRDRDGPAHAIAWPLTLFLLGLAGACAAFIAARLTLPPRGARAAGIAAAALLLAYGARILSGEREFSSAIAAYLAPALWLLAALIVLAARNRRRGAPAAAAGLALILAGSAIQRYGIAPGTSWLGASTLYHLVAGSGLVLLAVGALRLLEPPEA